MEDAEILHCVNAAIPVYDERHEFPLLDGVAAMTFHDLKAAGAEKASEVEAFRALEKNQRERVRHETIALFFTWSAVFYGGALVSFLGLSASKASLAAGTALMLGCLACGLGFFFAGLLYSLLPFPRFLAAKKEFKSDRKGSRLLTEKTALKGERASAYALILMLGGLSALPSFIVTLLILDNKVWRNPEIFLPFIFFFVIYALVHDRKMFRIYRQEPSAEPSDPAKPAGENS